MAAVAFSPARIAASTAAGADEPDFDFDSQVLVPLMNDFGALMQNELNQRRPDTRKAGWTAVAFVLFVILRKLRVLITYPIHIPHQAELALDRNRPYQATVRYSTRTDKAPVVVVVALTAVHPGARVVQKHAVIDLWRWTDVAPPVSAVPYVADEKQHLYPQHLYPWLRRPNADRVRALGGGWEETLIDSSGVTDMDEFRHLVVAAQDTRVALFPADGSWSTHCRASIQLGPTCVWMSTAVALHLLVAHDPYRDTQTICDEFASKLTAARTPPMCAACTETGCPNPAHTKPAPFCETTVMQPLVNAMFRFIDDVIAQQPSPGVARAQFNAGPSVLLGWMDAPRFRENNLHHVRTFAHELKRFARLDDLLRPSPPEPLSPVLIAQQSPSPARPRFVPPPPPRPPPPVSPRPPSPDLLAPQPRWRPRGVPPPPPPPPLRAPRVPRPLLTPQERKRRRLLYHLRSPVL
jgi:hypothetical protein